MQITRLRLNGFKSFVDPTDLVVADGLTGVVGPNGCGKSNLLEALRWVMGETRPSAMRGGGMEDVIFAGAATRPARNFAEVVVTIDNLERLAPAAFNQHDVIEIARRITREAGSAYRLHGKEVRARDVQMMFADASTGAHSPALVRQGQISELINARPKARRRVLEEAAGISGLYQRRHEAELKLRGAESNLERVDDVIGQLAGQLAQLARQAKQAARYREIGEALRRAEAAALYRRWRDAEAERAEAAARLTEAVREAGRAEAAAQAAMRTREGAETAMPPLREEEAIAAALVQRLAVERDRLTERASAAEGRVRALRGRLDQARKDRAREATLTGEADQTLADLAAERRDLIEAGEGHDARLDEAEGAADEAAEVLAAREEELGLATEAVARLSARHQSVERLLDDNRKTRDRAEAAAAAARAALQAARDDAEAGGAAVEEARAAQATAESVLAEAEAALAEAEAARATAQTEEAEARGHASEATGEAKALAAEAGALERLVERDEDGGAPLLDRVEVADGFEKAFGAALGDDLKAPLAGGAGASGWHSLGALTAAPVLPEGATPLAAHVTAPDLLDRRLSQIGLVAAEDGSRLQQRLAAGQRLVSAEGDVWRWDGYAATAAEAPSAAALKLEQRNRLVALRRAREAAEAVAAEAGSAHHIAADALRTASEAETAARGARREAEAAFGLAGRALDRAEADRRLAEGKAESLAMALARHEAEAADAHRQLADAERQHAALDDLGDSRARMDDLKTAVEAARITLLSRRSALDEVRRAGEARAARLGQIETGLRTWEARRDTADGRLADLAAREARTEADLAAAERAPDQIAAESAKLAGEIETAERRKTAAVDALAGGEAALRRAAEAERAAERAGADAREARARAETRRDAGAAAEAEARGRLVEEAGVPPEQVPERLDLAVDALSALPEIEAEIARLRRQRDALGAVNLRAEEDAAEVQQEHDTLAHEKADLEGAIAKLRAGIATLNREGRERLLTAFEEVNGHFAALFSHLFGGGEARLDLVESDDPLEAGLEILCQPPGKKLATLSLLSGGEQTLTALALIFAVFLANPAPICVLDEVDAPLDDANVTRFCDMLDEMTRRTRTRFLIITHHAVTMSRMDRLFGVTMAEQGVSQLVSVDLKRAAQMVA